MQVSDFDFELPSRLIANYPEPIRSRCRLLNLDGVTGQVSHGIFADIVAKITANDLVIFNDTRVIPARLFGHKATGGKFELLIERILAPQQALVHLKSSRAPKVGSCLEFHNSDAQAKVIARDGTLFLLDFNCLILPLLDEIGHIPLPPYIERPDEALDRELYQTVYSKKLGAVAAPTAGLHFDEELLQQLSEKGVAMQYVTLHVGAGTFLPIKGESLTEHVMHREYVEVNEAVVQAVRACKSRGGRVIAVGTTSVRALESAAQQALSHEVIVPFAADTQIFIYPGYQYRVVDALITNFHLPKSTLIMLVAAFAGYQNTLRAYQIAISEQYRFFSYGDAMFITRNPCVDKENSATMETIT